MDGMPCTTAPPGLETQVFIASEWQSRILLVGLIFLEMILFSARSCRSSVKPLSDKDSDILRSVLWAREGGAIDPSGFRDPVTGKRYLVWKVDGNTLMAGGPCGNEPPAGQKRAPTPIRIPEVSSSNGFMFLGHSVQILDRRSSDGPLVEAPALKAVKSPLGIHGYIYILFFSSTAITRNGTIIVTLLVLMASWMEEIQVSRGRRQIT